MKKIILIFFITLTINCNSQTNWLKKNQITTNKNNNTTTKLIIYNTKNTEIIDCDYSFMENITALFWKTDYLKDSSFSYMDYGGDTCYIGIKESKKIKIEVKIFDVYKVIAGYKCQKGEYLSNRVPKKKITIWFTSDTTFKDFFDNRNYNIKGIILETEDDKDIRTVSEITILLNEPEIVKAIAFIKKCNNIAPIEFKPIIDKAINDKQEKMIRPKK